MIRAEIVHARLWSVGVAVLPPGGRTWELQPEREPDFCLFYTIKQLVISV